MRAGDLNVIFHGQLAFVVHPECVEVLVPKVAEAPNRLAHAYLAGTVAPYDELTSPSYSLTGVNTSSMTRLPGRNFPVIGPRRLIDRSAGVLHCSIYIPFPAVFTPARCKKIQASAYFESDSKTKIDTTGLPLVYIFSYSFADFLRVRLDGLWSGTARTMNLHIFAEPRRPANGAIPEDHPLEAFRCMSRLFPGLDLNLLRWDCTEPRNLNHLPHPVSVNEQRSLCEPPPQPLQSTPLCVPLVVDNTW